MPGLPYLVHHETMNRIAGGVAALTPRFARLFAKELRGAYPQFIGRLLYAEQMIAVEAAYERAHLDFPPSPIPATWSYRNRPCPILHVYRAIDCYLSQMDPEFLKFCPAARELHEVQQMAAHATIADIDGYHALPWNNWPSPALVQIISG